METMDGKNRARHGSYLVGEEEMMIVGTVQQEDDGSWQDACNAWMDQDERQQ
jgi:hypothetical protein